jgi:hypothetical protein
MMQIHPRELLLGIGEEFAAVDDTIMVCVDAIEPTGQGLFAFWMAKRTTAQGFGIGAELNADGWRSIVR